MTFVNMFPKLGTFLIISFCSAISLPAQTWPKIYGGNTYTWLQGRVVETYDKGYLIAGQVDPGPGVPQMHGWIIKTDINGNPLWTKTIASSFYQAAFNGMDATPDGGFILSGVTTKLDPENYDVLIMKFDACGQKEWCKIFSTPGNSDFGLKIKTVPGGYVALVDFFQDWTTKRIWLFKLNEDGEPVWEKLINESDTSYLGSAGEDILITSDSGYLVTGDTYYGSPGHPYWLRPLIIKTDSAGNEQWTLPFGVQNGLRGDVAQFPSENSSGSFYMSARHFRDSIPLGDSPCFLKVSPSGQEVYYKDLVGYSQEGGSSTLLLKDNDSLFVGAAWRDSAGTENIGIIKCDTLGNISKTVVLFQDILYSLNAALFTFDAKYVTGGNFNPSGGNTKIYLYKFNANLDPDPGYSQPLAYGSLCPHPVWSDTTTADDCGVITKIDDPLTDPAKYRMRAYPDPAATLINLVIPESLLRRSAFGNYRTTTVYHQWRSATLQIYDFRGQLVFSKEIPKDIRAVPVDVSRWPRALYLARLIFMNETVAETKFLVE